MIYPIITLIFDEFWSLIKFHIFFISEKSIIFFYLFKSIVKAVEYFTIVTDDCRCDTNSDFRKISNAFLSKSTMSSAVQYLVCSGKRRRE